MGVYHVKPTAGPTTECPSGDSPCHSLQYYANHSSFTNNSRFLFLEGEHHLDSVVTISNVTNLSLVGAMSHSGGVKILGNAVPSGFHIEHFSNLSMENLAIYNCSGPMNNTLSLLSGSDVTLNHIAVFNSSGNGGTGHVAMDIVGHFSILDSSFVTQHGSNILVNYSSCSRPCSCQFNFTANHLSTVMNSTEMELWIYCSDVRALISDSSFESCFVIDYNMLIENSVVLSNNTFRGSVRVHMCTEEANHSCSHNVLKFDGNTFTFVLLLGLMGTTDCTIYIENSVFSDLCSQVMIGSGHDLSDTIVQVYLRNVTFADCGRLIDWKEKECDETFCQTLDHGSPIILVQNAAVLFEECTFENNTGSVIQAAYSKVVFKGYNIFRNNSALIGGGIQLIYSYMILNPDTHVVFQENNAEYVGGAIYVDTPPSGLCLFKVVDAQPAPSNTVQVSFMNNTAHYAGSDIYGDVERCCESSLTCDDFYDVCKTSNTENDPSAVASDPQEVCLCDDEALQPNCSDSNKVHHINAFPGQIFPIRLAVVGGRFNGVVPDVIRAYSFYNATPGYLQSSQVGDKPHCDNFHYSINSTEKTIGFKIVSEQYFFDQITDSTSGESLISVIVHLEECPVGFLLSIATGCYVCDQKLSRECNIDNQSFYALQTPG